MALSIEDTLSIQNLAARYNHAFDSGDGAAFAATFVPDGALAGGAEPIKGADALATFATTVAPTMPGVRHMVSNMIIDGDGDEATLRAYLLITVRDENGRIAPARSGVYSDTLVRQDGEWRFQERVFTAD